MTPERWQEIKVVLVVALELPPTQRPAYLDQSCVTDPSLRIEVERLLADEQQVQRQFLDTSHFAAIAAAVLNEDQDFWAGRRVGPYRIVELIGTGGMGEVYRAVRDDDEYRKEVALKVVRAGKDSGLVIGRFKNERQILATLDHSGIARLLDGGTTEDGMPYFVMELINGQPITEYCDQRRLSITERLRIFLDVCAAVQHAHQHLIIHRDIKPGNILVTAQAAPKLIDFGIAKILELDPFAGPSGATLTSFRILTPRYASPEQIKGEPMTTASDVYSLGVVLFELLTGQCPYRLTTGTPQDIAQAATESEKQRPSLAVLKSHPGLSASNPANPEDLSALRETSPEKLRKRLSGDLDNIVLMALRKEPSRRYPSVEQFAADIQRHLQNVPVAARKDTLRYRTSKFVRRHKTGVLAFSSATLAVFIGLGIAVHEARIARFERARAERRFNDVRKMANSLMFDAHDSIKDLPGTTPARKVLINGALQYLDSLSKEASGDESLQLELAAAYDRVGDLLGYTGAANLGDFRGAMQSYEKALTIRESAAAANPHDAKIKEDLLSNYFRLGFALQDAGDYPAALNRMRQALPLAQKLAAEHPVPRYQEWVAGVYWLTGRILARTDNYSQALDSFRHAVSIREPIANASPLFRTHLAGDYHGLASSLLRTGDVGGALEAVNKSLQIQDEMSQAHPTNATLREYLGETYDLAGRVHEERGDLEQSLSYQLKSHKLFRELASSDPTNSLARVNFGITATSVGKILVQQGKVHQAMPYIKNAISIFEPIESKTHYDISHQAEAYAALAGIYIALSDRDRLPVNKATHLREACSWYEKSLLLWNKSVALVPADAYGAKESRRVAQELERCDAALARFHSPIKNNEQIRD